MPVRLRVRHQLYDRLVYARLRRSLGGRCRYAVSGGAPLEKERVQDAINAGRDRLGEGGRLVIRPSGTEPLIRVMAEGDDQQLVNDVVDDIIGALKREAA